jgi:hypothetical protein
MVKFWTLAGARGLVVALRAPKAQPGRAGLLLGGDWPKEGPKRLLVGLLVLVGSCALQGGGGEQRGRVHRVGCCG